MLISIATTRDNERGPLAMASVLRALHQQNNSRAPVRFLHGSFEGKVGLFIDVPTSLCSHVEGQLAAQYPDLQLRRLTDDPFTTDTSGDTVWHCTLRLRPDLYPIRRYAQQYEEGGSRNFCDPLTTILEAVRPDERRGLRAVAEITARPASVWQASRARNAVERLAKADLYDRRHRTRRYARGITHQYRTVRRLTWLWHLPASFRHHTVAMDELTSSGTRAHDREAELLAASEKVGGFLYEAHLRIAVIGPRGEDRFARQYLQRVSSVFASTALPQMASFQIGPVTVEGAFPASPKQRGFLLCEEELATWFHPATEAVTAADLHVCRARQLEPPADLPNTSREKGSIPLGRVLYRERGDVCGLKSEDRRRHIYCIGRTGMGKSTLIENMIVHDIHRGRGVGLFDPHGDLFKTVLRSVPRSHWDRLVICDPSDTLRPVGFNAFDCSGLTAKQRAMVAGNMLSLFKKLYADSFKAAARMEDIFRNAFLALVEVDGATLLSVSRLLSDEAYRLHVVASIRNPVVRDFWAREYPGWTAKYRSEALPPVLNKIRSLMSNAFLQPILGQKESTINFRKIIDEGKILLVNLGGCDDDTKAFLGGVYITALQQAFMSRSDIPEEQRRDFYLYCDEFQHFDTKAMQTLLSESRKMHCNLVLSHQFLTQITDSTRDAIFGNCGTYITFGLGTDAEMVSRLYSGRIAPGDLVQLPKYHAYVVVAVRHAAQDDWLPEDE